MEVLQALKWADTWSPIPSHPPNGDAQALMALAAEVRRLRDLLSAAKWPDAPADRHAAQAEGKHPAPCARFCEANAFEIELRQLRRENERLRAQLMGPNAGAQATAREK